jgi:hypothetical protein
LYHRAVFLSLHFGGGRLNSVSTASDARRTDSNESLLIILHAKACERALTRTDMGRRIISITFAISFCLLAVRTPLAESIDFQSANASGGGQSGGAQTSQSGSVQTPQGVGGANGSQVQTVDLGDVTGTVCDCGEITPAGGEAAPEAASKGGFPKFPLLALAVLPGIACCRHSTPPPKPPDTPETPVPEPLTLITFAAGLSALAGLRSRRRRS